MRSFLKCVQDINAFCKLRNIQDPMFALCVDTNFLDSRANAGHWFPVIGFEPPLHPPQLEADNPADIRRKRPHVSARRCEPDEGLVCHRWNIQVFIYVVNTICGGCLTCCSRGRSAPPGRATGEASGLPAALYGAWTAEGFILRVVARWHRIARRTNGGAAARRVGDG